MSRVDDESLVRRFLNEAYRRRNLAVGDELLTADCLMHGATAIQGIAGWQMYATAFLSAFPDDLQISVKNTVAAEDEVAARWTAHDTHTGPLRGIAPTGREVKWLGVALCYLSGGKIRELWGLDDTLGMMQQIGAIPSP